MHIFIHEVRGTHSCTSIREGWRRFRAGREMKICGYVSPDGSIGVINFTTPCDKHSEALYLALEEHHPEILATEKWWQTSGGGSVHLDNGNPTITGRSHSLDGSLPETLVEAATEYVKQKLAEGA